MQPIFLIGFMCSGKTTLGHALSVRTGLEFIDLDHLIERRAGKTVREIFETEGEEAFRCLERDTLAEVSGLSDVIVACGGGTPCQPGAMELMNSRGITVRLVPNERRLVRRLMSGKHKRPLLAGIATAEDMRDFMIFTQAKREPYYGKAMYRFDSSLLENPEEVSQTVDTFISLYLNQG